MQFGDYCEYVHGEGEKNKASKVGGPLCRITLASYSPTPLHVSGALCQLHLLNLDVLLFVPSHQLTHSVPLIAIGSSSLPALSMQALLHVVHSLSAISKCHRRLLPFSYRRDEKK